MAQNPEMNILKNLSVEEFREFRALVIRLLLQTDMSSHFSALKDFKALQARPQRDMFERSRPRLVPARLKYYARHVRESLLFREKRSSGRS